MRLRPASSALEPSSAGQPASQSPSRPFIHPDLAGASQARGGVLTRPNEEARAERHGGAGGDDGPMPAAPPLRVMRPPRRLRVGRRCSHVLGYERRGADWWPPAAVCRVRPRPRTVAPQIAAEPTHRPATHLRVSQPASVVVSSVCVPPEQLQGVAAGFLNCCPHTRRFLQQHAAL